MKKKSKSNFSRRGFIGKAATAVAGFTIIPSHTVLGSGHIMNGVKRTKQSNSVTQSLSVLGDYDVVVCGGGPSGCAAAIASARNGARTLLIENNGYLGGTTVAAGVGWVLSTNSVDLQGIWHEWARRLINYRSMAPLIRSPSRFRDLLLFRSSVDSEGVKRVWDELVGEAGAEMLFLCHLCGVNVEDGVVKGVVVHTRAGLQLVRAKRVIDTSGNAAICHEAGVQWDRGVKDKLWPQQVTLVQRLGGFPVPGSEGGPLPGEAFTVGFRPERFSNIDRSWVDPLDPFAISAALRDTRREIWERAQKLPKGQYLVDTAAELGVRTSRIVQGIKRVSDEDAWEGRKAVDGIARSSWHIDIHRGPDEKYSEREYKSLSQTYYQFAKRLEGGDWFDIPYGCLVAAGVDNLLVAGRCISASFMPHLSSRIQQTCMATGQAAGVAAALSLQANTTPREFDPAAVVAQLKKDRDVELIFKKDSV